MRILVTGSREWDDWGALSRVFTEIARQTFQLDVTLVHGGARGADTMAAKAARMLGWQVEEHPADWDKHGKGAGHIRNQEMVDAGAEFAVAFLKIGAANRGTKDCIGRAAAAGIPVRRIEG